MKKHYKILAASWFMSVSAFVVAPAWAGCDLCSLVRDGDHAAIGELLNKRPAIYSGADAQSVSINGQNANGQTALLVGVRHNRLDIVSQLLNDELEPADPNIANQHGRTPLMWAAQRGNANILWELLERGADPHVVGSQNQQTALAFAMQGGHVQIGGELILRGVTLNTAAKTSEHLHSVVDPQNTADEGLDSFSRKLAEGIVAHLSVDFAIDGHPSPLFAAAASGDINLANALFADGANCSATNSDSQPPSEVAHQNGHDDLRDLLVLKECAPPLCPDEQQWSPDNKACVCAIPHPENPDECISAELRCRLMNKVHRPEHADADEYDCVMCPAKTFRHFNQCKCVHGHVKNNGVCVPTIEYCNSLDKIRNADRMCESCPSDEHRVGNECHPNIVPGGCTNMQRFVDGITGCVDCPAGHISKLPDREVCNPTAAHCYSQNRTHEGDSCGEVCDGAFEKPQNGQCVCYSSQAGLNVYRSGNRCTTREYEQCGHWTECSRR